MMEAHCDLIGRIALVADPRLGLVEQLAQGHGNLVKRNPEIAFARPELSGPTPYVAEHAPVQALDELLVQRIAAAAQRPILQRARYFLARLRSVHSDRPHARGLGRAFPQASAAWHCAAPGKGRSRANPRTAAGSSRAPPPQGALRCPSPLPAGPPATSSARLAPGACTRTGAPRRGPWPLAACWARKHRQVCSRAPRPHAARSPVRWLLCLRIARWRRLKVALHLSASPTAPWSCQAPP